MIEYSKKQLEAIKAPIGPVLVLAGPGAGKTRCLAGRIVHMVEKLGVVPSRICAITFTNKAADEIEHRVREQLGPTAEELTLGTIHSMCLNLLRTHARHVGLRAGIGVADEDSQQLILKRMRIPEWRRKFLLDQFGKHRCGRIALDDEEKAIFGDYAKELRLSGLIDFDEILLFTRKLFETTEAVREEIFGRWDHVLVDECQDLDRTQYEIIAALAKQHRSLFFVGDDEQSIFTWRGADPSIIRTFLEDFGIERPILLDKNHRCSKAIFETARKILPPDTIFSCREIEAIKESEFPVEAIGHSDPHAESSWITAQLLEARRTGGIFRYGECAVLYRNHANGQIFEAALLAANIPSQLAKGRSMSERPVVAHVAASLQLMLEPNSELALVRFAEIAIGEPFVDRLSAGEGTNFEEKCKAYAFRSQKADRSEVCRFLYAADNIRHLKKTILNLSQFVDAALNQGVGVRKSPLDDYLPRIQDPMGNPNAVRWAERFTEAEESSRRVLVAARHPLGIVVRFLLSQVFPQLKVVEWEPGDDRFPDDVLVEFEGNAQLLFAQLFAALRICSTRRTEKSFREYVVFDTETTDLNTNECDVIELAAVRVRDGQIVGEYHSLIFTERPIAPGATQNAHGYTSADIEGQPTLAEKWPEFLAFVGDSLLIGHNAYGFDLPVLERLTQDIGGIADLSFFDSYPFARHIVREGSLKLADLAAKFGIPTGRSHRALDDCICLAKLFERLQEEQIANVRKTALSKFLDYYAIGMALAGPHLKPGIALDIFHIGAKRALGRFSNALEHCEREAQRLNLESFTTADLIDRLGGQDLMNRLRRERTHDDWYPEEMDFLRRLIPLAEGESLEESARVLLDKLALSRSSETDLDPDRVALLTFHATKGLEFTRVFVTGVEDSILPGTKTIENNNGAEIDEAKRLLYVAMTRAKDKLCLTYTRTPNGGTRFLDQMGLIPQQV